ncbi:MAG: hypothetical protein DLM61_00540 [Pseudonocardiales bacterium]|nr:MAG: hypothetical protein DLM61_00540 [Pseudonocardiales bacterium]
MWTCTLVHALVSAAWINKVRCGSRWHLIQPPADWRTHFGSHWRQLQLAKQEFDPYGILTPGYGIVSTS